MFAPERFDDWYKHLTNQGAHGGLVGFPAGLATALVLQPLWAWVAVVLFYLIYEALVQSGLDDDFSLLWDWRDSLDDTANVAAGAGLVLVLLYCAASFWAAWFSAVAVMAAWGLSLAYSVWRRI